MVNTRAKGQKAQLEAIKLMEKAGFLVDKVEVGGRWEKSKDLFGLFDIIGIRKNEMYLMQVTSNKPHPHKYYLEFSKQFPLKEVKYGQMVRYDRKGWKYFWYENGKKTVEDKRK